MRRTALRWSIGGWCLVLALGALASGPLGHTLMARDTAAKILSGQLSAPAELRDVLKDPDGLRAYLGGSIGPDIDESAHYKKTSAIPTRMIAEAKKDLAKALSAKDPGKIKAARQELAFGYGWLNHAAADLNIHPVINAATGDTYRYNGSVAKTLHAELEAEFTAFLAHGRPLPAYDIYVPIDFMAKTAFSSKSAIKDGLKVLNFKAASERKYAETRGFKNDFEGAFRIVESGAMSDNAAFLRSSSNLKDWDLDCGKISTSDFETLREAAIRANKGTLPTTWGQKYLEWHRRTAGLTLAKKIIVMTAILGGAGTPDAVPPVKPKSDPNPIPKDGAWVLEGSGFSVDYSDSQIDPKYQVRETGSSGTGTSQATVGHPDPSIFITVRLRVVWTVPDEMLIPGKKYTMRFAASDNGSDDNRGLFIGGFGSLGANCPAVGDVWYGPSASIDLHAKRMQAEATKDYTPPSAPEGSELYIQARWSTGIRSGIYTYVYRFKKRKG